MRQVRIAGAEDDIPAEVAIELGFQSGLDVDLGQNAEPFVLQRVDYSRPGPIERDTREMRPCTRKKGLLVWEQAWSYSFECAADRSSGWVLSTLAV